MLNPPILLPFLLESVLTEILREWEKNPLQNNVYLPLLGDNRIVRVPPDECHVFRTRERVMIFLSIFFQETRIVGVLFLSNKSPLYKGEGGRHVFFVRGRVMSSYI